MFLNILRQHRPCATADLSAIRQTLAILLDILRQTGIGALPVIPLSENQNASLKASDISKIVAETTALFERLRKRQEGAATVANLLATDSGTRGSVNGK
jgi:hypothetical protein